ncbi:MAG TPA: hypothetical protein VF355_06230 [Anaerolineaceae bacterium]
MPSFHPTAGTYGMAVKTAIPMLQIVITIRLVLNEIQGSSPVGEVACFAGAGPVVWAL